MRQAKWNPPTDLYRTPEGWVLKFDLAGVRPQDVEVELIGRNLRITGARKDWLVEEGWRHYSMEIQYDHFERVIRLPAGAEGAFLTREFRGGMLLLHLQHRKGAGHVQ